MGFLSGIEVTQENDCTEGEENEYELNIKVFTEFWTESESWRVMSNRP